MDKRSLQELLHYISRTVPENACNAKLREIQRYVDELKQDSWIEEVYVTLGEYIEDEVTREVRRLEEEAKAREEEAKAREEEAKVRAEEAKVRAEKAEAERDVISRENKELREQLEILKKRLEMSNQRSL